MAPRACCWIARKSLIRSTGEPASAGRDGRILARPPASDATRLLPILRSGDTRPPARADDRTPMIGQTLGHYRIVREIGADGMGVVYQAEDTTSRLQAGDPVLDQLPVQRFSIEAKHPRRGSLVSGRVA